MIKLEKNVGFVLNEERSFYWQLTEAGLEGDGHKLVGGYSSGMKQRLAIARGLLSNPNIRILDEPTRTLTPISLQDIKSYYF